MQKHRIIVSAALLFICTAVLSAQDKLEISVVRDGRPEKTVELHLLKKMGYLQARDVADIFGAGISYDADSKELVLKWGEPASPVEVKFVIGSEYVVIDGIKRKMMKSPRIIEGHSYIPLEAVITRAFEAVVGAQVHWSYDKRALSISYKGNISDVRAYTYDSYTRVVVELTQDLEYEYGEKDRTVTVKIKNGVFTVPFEDISIADGVVESVAIAASGEGAVFSIGLQDDAGEVKVMKYPSPVRVVIDIEKKIKEAVQEKKEALPPVPAGPLKKGKMELKDIKLIVIDPGHGGKDPGAIGPRGTREKDITLSIAEKVARKIKKDLKIRTILTRTHDYFVPLSERIGMANSKNADIFISIHTNAAMNPKSNGFEVYFLSGDASDREAEAVANMENSVMAMEESSAGTTRLSKILWSLTMNQFMNESSELCSFMDKCVIRKTGLVDRGVKQAGFYVMKGARMPAVLVEVAFLSNKKEEKLLNSDSFQEGVADAVTRAVSDYKRWLTQNE